MKGLKVERINNKKEITVQPFNHSTIKLRKQYAFTLAEVLITLGIIGVVAALTIPTLVNNYKKVVFKSQFKHSYATLNQVTKMAADYLNVNALGSYCTVYDGKNYVNADACYDAIAHAYKNSVQASDWNNKLIERDGQIKTFNENVAVLVDSIQFHIKKQQQMPDGTYLGFFVNGAQLLLGVDVNGEAGPNQLGYDVFSFCVDKKSDFVTYCAVPAEAKTDEELEAYRKHLEDINKPSIDYYVSVYGAPCNKTSTQTSNGFYCSYYAIKDICYDGSGRGYFDCLFD